MDRPNDEERAPAHEVRQRIARPATPQEKQRHGQIREEIEEELPELKRWAREAAGRHAGRIPVGTVFGEEEADVVRAIDQLRGGPRAGRPQRRGPRGARATLAHRYPAAAGRPTLNARAG